MFDLTYKPVMKTFFVPFIGQRAAGFGNNIQIDFSKVASLELLQESIAQENGRHKVFYLARCS